jgi:hypothetical protein
MKGVLLVAKKFLMRNDYEFDGFTYRFTDIKEDQEFVQTLVFYVQVFLPDPNQSYVTEVFLQTIEKIIDSFFDFMGRQFSTRLIVTTEDDKEDFVYIRESQCNKIIESFNKQFNEIGLKVDGLKVNFNCFFGPSTVRDFYELDNDELSFNFDLHLTNLVVNDEFVNIKENSLGKVAQRISDTMYDMDWYQSELHDIIFFIINPETQISDSNVFISVLHNIKSINYEEKIKNQSGFISEKDFVPIKKS